jgi:hypothetical protein
MSDPIIDDMLKAQRDGTGVAASTPAVDPIAAQMADEESAQRAKAALTVSFSADSDPQAAARNQQLAKRYKVPSSVVEQWPDEFKQRALLEDTRDQLANAPALQARLAQDPDLAKLVHNDVPNAAALESSVRMMEARPYTPSLGQRILDWRDNLFGVAERRKAEAWRDYAHAGLRHDARASARGRGRHVRRPRAGGIEGAQHGHVRHPAGHGGRTDHDLRCRGRRRRQPRRVHPGPREVCRRTLAGRGPARGERGRQRAHGYRQGRRQRWRALGLASLLAEVVPSLNNPDVLSAVEQDLKAAGQGTATGALFGVLGKALPDNTIAQTLTRIAGANVGSDLISGTNPLETIQNWDQLSQPEKVEKLTNYLVNSAFSFHGAGRMVAEEGADQARAEQAQTAAQMMGLFSRLSQESKLRGLDPEQFSQYVRDVADNSGVTHLYVDAESLSNVLQQSGIEPAELQRLMPEVAEQLGTAAQSDGMVRIPLEDYATHVAGSVVDEALMPHLRTDPEAMTFQEAEQFYQSQAERLTRNAQRLVGEKAQDDEFKASGQAVEDEVLRQLNVLNRFPASVNKAYASMWRAFFETAGAKSGRLPRCLLGDYDATFRGDLDPSAAYDQPFRGPRRRPRPSSRAPRTSTSMAPSAPPSTATASRSIGRRKACAISGAGSATARPSTPRASAGGLPRHRPLVRHVQSWPRRRDVLHRGPGARGPVRHQQAARVLEDREARRSHRPEQRRLQARAEDVQRERRLLVERGCDGGAHER